MGYRVGNFNGCEGGTPLKRSVFNTRYRVWYLNGGEPGTVPKSPITNTGYGVWNFNGCKVGTGIKSLLPDAGYCVYRSVVVNRIGYTNLASCGAVIYFASFV